MLQLDYFLRNQSQSIASPHRGQEGDGNTPPACQVPETLIQKDILMTQSLGTLSAFVHHFEH